MTFFEKEWRKLLSLGLELQNPAFVGRSCYARLDGELRIRLEFVSDRIGGQYEAIRATLINRRDDPIVSVWLWFRDILGVRKVNNPSFPGGLSPYIWEGSGGPEWYVYQPSALEYGKLAEAVNGYTAMFQELQQPQNQTGPVME